MAKLPRVKPGDLIDASAFNAIAEALEAFHNLDVAPDGYLRIDRHPAGIGFWLAVPTGVWARLTSNTSPYDWEEVEPKADGTWATFATGRSGTGDAYEYNGLDGLQDKVVKLRSSPVGDWRFYWLGTGGTSTCTGTTRICVTVNTGCPGAQGQSYNATVTVSKGGVDYGPCSTAQTGNCCIEVPESGTYTVTAEIPGASPISTTVSVVCDIDNNVTLTFPASSIGRLCVSAVLCDGSTGNIPVAGSVSITGPGSISDTCDAGTGQVCFSLAAGTYSVAVSYPTGYSETRSVSVGACLTTNVAFSAVNGTYVNLFFGVAGCSYTFTLKDPGGTTLASCVITADAFGNGNCTLTYGDRKQSSTSDGSTMTVTATVTNSSAAFAYNCYTPTVPFNFNANHIC